MSLCQRLPSLAAAKVYRSTDRNEIPVLRFLPYYRDSSVEELETPGPGESGLSSSNHTTTIFPARTLPGIRTIGLLNPSSICHPFYSAYGFCPCSQVDWRTCELSYDSGFEDGSSPEQDWLSYSRIQLPTPKSDHEECSLCSRLAISNLLNPIDQFSGTHDVQVYQVTDVAYDDVAYDDVIAASRAQHTAQESICESDFNDDYDETSQPRHPMADIPMASTEVDGPQIKIKESEENDDSKSDDYPMMLKTRSVGEASASPRLPTPTSISSILSSSRVESSRSPSPPSRIRLRFRREETGRLSATSYRASSSPEESCTPPEDSNSSNIRLVFRRSARGKLSVSSYRYSPY